MYTSEASHNEQSCLINHSYSRKGREVSETAGLASLELVIEPELLAPLEFTHLK